MKLITGRGKHLTQGTSLGELHRVSEGKQPKKGKQLRLISLERAELYRE